MTKIFALMVFSPVFVGVCFAGDSDKASDKKSDSPKRKHPNGRDGAIPAAVTKTLKYSMGVTDCIEWEKQTTVEGEVVEENDDNEIKEDAETKVEHDSGVAGVQIHPCH